MARLFAPNTLSPATWRTPTEWPPWGRGGSVSRSVYTRPMTRLIFHFLDGFSWTSSPLSASQCADWLQTWQECRAGDRPAFVLRWPGSVLDLGAAYRVTAEPA